MPPHTKGKHSAPLPRTQSLRENEIRGSRRTATAMNLLSLSRFALIAVFTAVYTSLGTFSYEGTTTVSPTESQLEFVRESCKATVYPKLCFNSLQPYAARVHRSPRRLAHTALRVSMIHVIQTLGNMSAIPSKSMSSREAGAVKDCLENLDDSRYQIKTSMREFRYMVSGNVGFHISNIQTWVSAAITDEETCKDGFDEIAAGNLRFVVGMMMTNIERLTSNSLALVNRYAHIIIPKQV